MNSTNEIILPERPDFSLKTSETRCSLVTNAGETRQCKQRKQSDHLMVIHSCYVSGHGHILISNEIVSIFPATIRVKPVALWSQKNEEKNSIRSTVLYRLICQERIFYTKYAHCRNFYLSGVPKFNLGF
jgi:hypothetical protein